MGEAFPLHDEELIRKELNISKSITSFVKLTMIGKNEM